MIVILMGVSGAGKTAVGQVLAADLGWPFHDGDDFHPPANVEKMHRGVPLTDADRAPWLAALHRLIVQLARDGRSAVVTCSALKQSYRDRLVAGVEDARFVYLRGDPALLRSRLAQRRGRFMPAELLQSQLDALEEPRAAITVDVAGPPAAVADEIRRQLSV